MQPRSVIPIRRQQIFSYLALAVFCATLTASCSDNSDISSVPEVPPNDAIADQPVEAIFYENVSQCQQWTPEPHVLDLVLNALPKSTQ